MLTVRFPDGTAIQYNEATTISKTAFGWRLYKKQDAAGKFEGWIADIPSTCIIEAVRPCSISNPVKEPKAMIAWVTEHLREMPASNLVHLKSSLNDFDSRKRRWK
jgi:hypothetical protein